MLFDDSFGRYFRIFAQNTILGSSEEGIEVWWEKKGKKKVLCVVSGLLSGDIVFVLCWQKNLAKQFLSVIFFVSYTTTFLKFRVKWCGVVWYGRRKWEKKKKKAGQLSLSVLVSFTSILWTLPTGCTAFLSSSPLLTSRFVQHHRSQFSAFFFSLSQLLFLSHKIIKMQSAPSA